MDPALVVGGVALLATPLVAVVLGWLARGQVEDARVSERDARIEALRLALAAAVDDAQRVTRAAGGVLATAREVGRALGVDDPGERAAGLLRAGLDGPAAGPAAGGPPV